MDVGFVVTIHDEIIADLGGLPGFAGIGIGAVEAALARVEHHAVYGGLDDVLGIAALYAEAIARGHVFNDGNKRTALTCAIAYLDQQGIHVPEASLLEQATVDLAQGTCTREEFAVALGLLAELDGRMD